MFAINIDNSNLNNSIKIAKSNSLSKNETLPAQNSSNQTDLAGSFTGNSLSNVETTAIKIKKTNPLNNQNVNNRKNNLKIRKNNVVVSDDDIEDNSSADEKNNKLPQNLISKKDFSKENIDKMTRSKSQVEFNRSLENNKVLSHPIKFQKTNLTSEIGKIIY